MMGQFFKLLDSDANFSGYFAFFEDFFAFTYFKHGIKITQKFKTKTLVYNIDYYIPTFQTKVV